MLTPHLQKKLDEKWNNCWPVSDLRPLALLDLISYLFFIKKLDDWELIHQRVKTAGADNFIYTKEIEEFTWSKLQKLNAREIQQLFNKEHGVIDLMKNYANLNALYSDFFKAPLLIDPTPKLIFNAIEIINIIETSDKISQGYIIEYLFDKSKVSAQKEQEFLPEYICRLMVSIAEPETKDAILNLSVGNGNLLINIYRHLYNNINSVGQSPSNIFIESKINGIESDLIKLRLAAMNLVLHGIKNPKIRSATTENKLLTENPTLIISSLIFSNDNSLTEKNNTDTGKLEKENLLLTEIVETLKPGGRAVILVPQVLLKSDNPGIIKTRKNIVDHSSLEAVITLAAKTESVYSGAGILFFNKSKTASENIWFCKWGKSKKKTINESLSDNNSQNDDFEFNELTEILNKWKDRKDEKDFSNNSFFISANFIKTNQYNLSFNDYKLIRQKQPLDTETESINTGETEKILAAKKENLHEFFEATAPLPEEKRKRMVVPVIAAIIILMLGGAAYYWFYLKDNHSYSKNKITNSISNINVSNASKEAQAKTLQMKSPANKTDNDPAPDNTTTKSAVTENSTTENTTSTNESSKKYTVINKTWFHFGPDQGKIKPVFLNPRKDVVLTPQAEENGFVYVVYVNSKGQSTRGWLNKKDLEPVE